MWRTTQQRLALVLQVQCRVGCPRRFAAAVGLHSRRLDLRGGDLLPSAAGRHVGARARCDGPDQYRFPAVPDRHLQSVRAVAAAGADGWPGPQPATAGLRSDRASPMLMGYVGFSVAFAFAIAALLGGRLDAAWARWSRPWTLVAWAFLGLGIALGSWWAYYELGWGGWWFWDPVENASFMPWLVGTALIHSLAVTENAASSRAGRCCWRSRPLVEPARHLPRPLRCTHFRSRLRYRSRARRVHPGVPADGGRWLADPVRLRAPVVKSQVGFGLWSRETLLLVNNLLLVVATAMILLGTLYPLLLDALSGAKLSVGRRTSMPCSCR